MSRPSVRSASRRQIWDLLRALNPRHDDPLTMHYIDETQYLCGRIALIDQERWSVMII